MLKPLAIRDDRPREPDFDAEHGADELRHLADLVIHVSKGVNPMVIGRMHVKDGLVCERTHDSGKPIRLGLTHGGDPFNKNTPAIWFDFTEEQFASMVAHASRRGEHAQTFSEALVLLQTDSFEDDDAGVQPNGERAQTR